MNAPQASPQTERPPLPAYAQTFIDALRAADVEIVAALPESLLKHVFRALPEVPGIRYVRVSNEADMPGIVTGAYFGGKRALMIMENSGLRQACEPIARLAWVHHLPMVMVVSFRGDLGEPNYWGHNHSQVMEPILDALRIPYWVIRTLDELTPAMQKAFVHADTSQWPVCLVMAGECVDGGKVA